MKKKLGYGLLGLAIFDLIWFYAFWVIPALVFWKKGELYPIVNALYVPVTIYLLFVLIWGIGLVAYHTQEKCITRCFWHCFILTGTALSYILLILLGFIFVFVSFDWITDCVF